MAASEQNTVGGVAIERTPKRIKRTRLAVRGSPIEQAVALRDGLVTVARQANELIRSLKRHKRQARLVESTLQSLKALQKVAG